ncbi:MAG: HAD-IIA family hydrolase [Methylococcales symbiont of Hymedesmia sp. n. MRB-2018]|nr:MAG: HAD-IIA family hydrolase [Methylococcales symbiont of Hymedesmia sp. n. MRB-2018]KAF3983866.1 MAG: HAD-IIA family hydrolase [Methylococcales symbiont of Hymedesmia sp. n. MRB-2018]
MQNFTDVKALIIDMDGVLWQGNYPLPGLDDFFRCLRKQSIPFILATNNSSLTQTQYLTKLSSMGVAVSNDEILTSSMATAYYLNEQVIPSETSLFIIGEEGLRLPLIEQGFNLINIDQLKDCDPNDVSPDYVVCGLDREITWEKMAIANLYLCAGAKFIASNGDTSLPLEVGTVPGNGATLAALQASSAISPIVIGKPQAIMYQQAIKFLGVGKENTIAIGDRLDTDILGAVNTGIRSIMVLTGISTVEDFKDIEYRPTWIMDDLLTITNALQTLK